MALFYKNTMKYVQLQWTNNICVEGFISATLYVHTSKWIMRILNNIKPYIYP
jgi:hypothetical protein